MKCANFAFYVVPGTNDGDAERVEFSIVICFGVMLAPIWFFPL